ncbi:hypothetical protein ACFU44_32365 [Nocardia rhizosphaerihabitans]|uniref:hypothetical protein n=1 Tax=Nocardia rhizosphaerihabitans TaxID=1691570 RepID=UPI003671C19D
MSTSPDRVRDVARWEQRVRLFGLAVLAVPPTLIGCGLMFTFVGEWAGVGPVQRVVIGCALLMQVPAIGVSWRVPPTGRCLIVVRSAFFATYAAVAVAAALLAREEDWEILSIPVFLMLIFALHALYERCVRRFEKFGGAEAGA